MPSVGIMKAIVWCELYRFFRIGDCSGKIAGIAVESDKGEENIAVVGMLIERSFQNVHCLIISTGRMQPDRIDIGVSRPMRIKLGCALKFSKRRFGLLEPDECEAKSVM